LCGVSSADGHDVKAMSNRTHYGRLNWATLPNEVRRIWSTRNDELPDGDVSWKWSWEHEDRHDDRVERADFVRKLIEVTPLTEREAEVIQLCNLEDHTFEDVAERWGLTRERVRQVQLKALRRLRKHSSVLTNIPSWEIDPTVMTWSWWSLTQRAKRRRAA